MSTTDDICALEQCRDELRAQVAELGEAQAKVDAELSTVVAGLLAIENLIEFKRLGH